MYPPGFAERLTQQKYIDVPVLLGALDKPSAVSIRLNPEKWNKVPENASQVPWADNGYYLQTRPSFTSDPLFHSGCYYPQEASGMFLEQAFNQVVANTGYIRALDLCGAPGGKSTHLSTLIGNAGFLVANEVIKSRAGILDEIITKWGTGNAIVTNNDPSSFGRIGGYFDLILVDAPCSGEGMFSDVKVRNEWSVDNAAMCSERQRRILTDVWPSLKEDGVLIYSTCTFNPAENEENIKWLAEKTGGISVKVDVSKFSGVEEISYSGITGYGFHPGKISGEGLFMAVIRKPGLPSKASKFPFKKGDNKLTNNDIKIAGKLIETTHQNLYRHDDIVYELSLPPEEYLFLKNYLRIIKGGSALYKTRKDDYTPLHELAISTKILDDAFPAVELDYSQSVSYLKKENLHLRDAEKGWILLRFKGVNLGFAKNLGSRINNYFPVDWRIRMEQRDMSDKNLVSWSKIS
jgi:16S rRNA C967 or C1407 C5-methylase (RsmB/RsmF family)/NOL1/NOP2/fmu family ribosome biogenesis protein